MARTLLHLSPHPDDELAGMPATLMALRDAGWRIVNLACGPAGLSSTCAGWPSWMRPAGARVSSSCRAIPRSRSRPATT